MALEFLSPDWIVAMRRLRAEFGERERENPVDVAVNVTVTGVPFDDAGVRGHIDTTGPALTIEQGHLAEPDFSIEMPYHLALQLFVERDPGAVISALFGGRVRLSGDSSKVLLLAGALTPPPPDDPRHAELRELVRRVDELTAPAGAAHPTAPPGPSVTAPAGSSGRRR